MWTDPEIAARTKALKEALNALLLKVATRFEGSIEVSRGGSTTSYPCAREAQSKLIWAMR
jgi:hypothetical protein